MDLGSKRAVSSKTGPAALLALGVTLGLMPQIDAQDVVPLTRGAERFDPVLPSFREQFGSSAAVDEDVLVIGAPDDREVGFVTGAAYLFVRGAEGWVFSRKLLPPAPGPNQTIYQGFGTSVDVDGDLVAVGFPKVGPGNSIDGEVHVFDRNAGGLDQWGRLAILTPPPGCREFGTDVALDGNRLAVDAGDDGGQFGGWYGDVHLFGRHVGGENAWGSLASMQDSQCSDGYGQRVSLDDDVLVVAANPGRIFQGCAGFSSPADPTAYVYERDFGGTGSWSLRTALTAPDPSSATFAWSAEVRGDRIAIRDGAQVHLYERDAAHPQGWSLVTTVGRDDTAIAGMAFTGSSLVLAHGPRRSFAPSLYGPSAWVYDRSPSGSWEWTGLFLVPQAGLNDAFGAAVSLAGTELLVGAPNTASGTGAAYRIDLAPSPRPLPSAGAPLLR